ncbi:ComEC/Rec2 family competence protein [Alicyclobacillaceae bacterium I2511]|nr:ComEC/Rec2 family competence protein [Alicyclobacillaceae bacterium I2511]
MRDWRGTANRWGKSKAIFMRSDRRLRWRMWVVLQILFLQTGYVFTAWRGFLLTGPSQSTHLWENNSWFLRLAVGISLIGLMGVLLVKLQWQSRGRRRDRIRSSIGWGMSISLLFLFYGLSRGAVAPVVLESWLGTPLLANATVTSVHSTAFGNWVHLNIGSVTPDLGGNYSLSSKIDGRPCNLSSSWHVKTNLAIQQGDRVVLRGILSTPSLTTESSTFKGQWLPVYDFSGGMVALQHSNGSWFGPLRMKIHDILARNSGLPAEHQVLLESIVFGGATPSPALHKAFLTAGLLHVMAASGANVILLEAMMQRLLYPVWRRLHLGLLSWSVLQVTFTWVFAGLCQFQVSVVRAAWMNTYRRLGEFLGRKAAPGQGWLAALWLMSVTWPESLWSVGAWLSFVATAALERAVYASQMSGQSTVSEVANPLVQKTKQRLVWQKRMSAWASTVHQRFWLTVRSGLMVELHLLPLIWTLFGNWAPLSLLSNVVMDPVLALLLPIAALYIVLLTAVAVFPWLTICADLFEWTADQLLLTLLAWVNWTASHAWALWSLPSLSGWVWIPYYAILWWGISGVRWSVIHFRLRYSV